MEDSFLSSLSDTTGNNYLFGKLESAHQSAFIYSVQNNKSLIKQAQIYKGHEQKLVNNEPLLRNNISTYDLNFLT